MGCKIKLFRDKGAERKNKDDTKQIERQLERLREKGEGGWLPLAPALPVTLFTKLDLSQGIKRTATSQLLPRNKRSMVTKRCLLIRFEPNEIYRAIYLDALTVQDLLEKLLEKTHLEKPVTHILYKELPMKDHMVQTMMDNQDLTLQIQENSDRLSLTLFL
ncbi:hypothetical protein BY458DRAFT_525839, partial [Sporodiniella umbellata]